MIFENINSYFNSKCFKPFLAYVDDDNYLSIKESVESTGNVTTLRVSDCCDNIDKKPNMDKLRNMLRELDVDFSSNKFLLLGLGEYLMLEGINKARNIINEMLSFNLGTAHLVCLIKGFRNELCEMYNSDVRMNRQISVSSQGTNNIDLIISPFELGIYPINGLKAILRTLEDSSAIQLSANSSVYFSKPMLHLTYVNNYYEALKSKYSLKIDEIIEEKYTEQLWCDFETCKSFEAIFAKYNFYMDFTEDFYDTISNDSYRNWLYFVYLKLNLKRITNIYVNFVVKNTAKFSELKNNILSAISSIKAEDEDFDKYYDSRKKIVKYYTESEIAEFIVQNSRNIKEGINNLTDITMTERHAIIEYASIYGIPKKLKKIYPDLYYYLAEYNFTDCPIKQELTEYFNEYKKEKISNNISDNFIQKVDSYALEKKYNILPGRNSLVMETKSLGTFLCWIDALGVEYLSFIVEIAKKKGLRCSIKIGRADLPTITPVNRSFFDDWDVNNRIKVDGLDDLKHKENSIYQYGPNNLYPIYLAEELDIIKKVIENAAIALSLHKYTKYVIASDHGASRLAVLAKKDEKYETDTKGEHSGRCCKCTELNHYDLPFASEENNYIVLADYGRFKGSRAANVEVHGGASLEEVVVPIITLSLKSHEVKFEFPEKVFVDRKTGVEVEIYVDSVVGEDIYLEYSGEKYKTIKIDDYHLQAYIPDIKKAGEFLINVYVGEDLETSLKLKTVGKMASMNNDFDDLF